MILVDELRRWAEERGLPCDVALTGDIAIFSPCRRYRYVLTRKIGEEPTMLVGSGLNPSTANAQRNDPTIRRGIGFGQRWKHGQYVMVNAYGFRSTDPRALFNGGPDFDPVGEHNDEAIAFVLSLITYRDTALAAWGAHVTAERAEELNLLVDAAGVRWSCLGQNKDGSPKHILYLAAATPLRPWHRLVPGTLRRAGGSTCP